MPTTRSCPLPESTAPALSTSVHSHTPALLSHCWQRVRILSNYSCYYHDYYYYYYYDDDDDYYGVPGSMSLSLCFRIVVVLCAHCPLVVMTPLGIGARYVSH